MPFDILIVGAGLGGLSAALFLQKRGHKVTVLEGSGQLNEVGAGIQIPSNSTRLLDQYGLTDQLDKVVVKPSQINLRRYADGRPIGKTPLVPEMVENYGFPYWVIHRADYQQLLYDACLLAGVEIRLGARVDSVDASVPCAHLEDGSTVGADLVIGADGIRSKIRASILGADDVMAEPSPNCAYRAIVSRELMMSDKQTAGFMTSPAANCWLGFGRHIMAYPIRRGTQYNIVMSHPGKASVGKWSEPGDVHEMRKTYEKFDPSIRKALEYVDVALKWLLADIPPLKRWHSENGRVILLGDSAHAMLPYMSQGAAQALEDAAALTECLCRCKSASDIPQYVQAYQDFRKPRVERIQQYARLNGKVWHYPDGEEQERRDRAMSGQLREGENDPNLWADKTLGPWLFGHDASKEANAYLDEIEAAKGQQIRSNL